MNELLNNINNRFLRYVFVIYFIFLVFPLLSQNSKEDYAEFIYQKSIDYLNSGSLDSARISALELRDYSINNSLPNYVAKSYYGTGNVLSVQGELDSALFYYYKSDSLYDPDENVLIKGKVNARIALIHKNQNKLDLAIEYFSISLKVFEIVNDTLWLGVVNNHLGSLYFSEGNYYLTLKYFQNAIKNFKSLNHLLNIGSVYNAIGLVYRKINDVEKEKVAYLNAIRILEKLDDSKHLANAYINLSEVYFDDNEIELGLESLEKAKAIYEELDYNIGLCAYYAVLSYFYSTRSPVDYERVLENGLKGLGIAQEIGSLRQYADACYFIGLAYVETNQIEKAKTILEEGCQISKEYDYKFELVRLSGLLADVYDDLKLHQKAFETLYQYVSYKDSLSSDAKIKEFTSLDLSYQFKQEQLKDSVAQVHKNNELQHVHNQEMQSQKILQLVLVFFVIVVLIIAVFGFIISRKRKIQSEILNQKNETINKSLYEKELLLKEIHHRVKNNFQTVSSLLDLQVRNITDEQAIVNIEEGQSRIKAMALIHQKLYQNDDISVIDFQDYAMQLARQIVNTYSLNNLAIDVYAYNIKLDVDTSIPLGLILNELITNSCKYAFEGNVKDKLTIRLTQKSNEFYLMEVSDTGKGIPSDIDLEKVKSLGLRLAKRLAKQLHGNLQYHFNNGCVFELEFKDTLARKEVE